MESVRPIATPYATPLPGTSWRESVAPPPSPAPRAGFEPDRIDRGMPSLPLVAGAKAAYDFLLGDDLNSVFGEKKTAAERGLGAASLASNFIPVGKLIGIAAKAIAHVGVALGTHAATHAAVVGGTRLAAHSTAAIANGAMKIVTSVLRDVGGLHPSLNLASIERGIAGHPHTLEMHVAKDEAFLEERIRKGKGAASTFTDLSSAQRSVDSVISENQNQVRIAAWIEGGMDGTLRLDGFVPGDAIGRVLSRADVVAGTASRASDHATVILKSDAESPSKYTILTSYPSFPKE